MELDYLGVAAKREHPARLFDRRRLTMKNSFLAFTALAVVLTASGAKADDLAAIRQQTAFLKKKNEALAKRLEILEKRQAAGQRVANQPTHLPAPAPGAHVADALLTKRPLDVLTNDGPITWHGVTLFGVIDAGLAWQSHGAPPNGYFPQGLEYAISRNSNRAGFNIAPGGMGYSGIGLKGQQELLPGWAGVFAANTQFNPASGQLGNGPQSLVQNNGVATPDQSSNGDSARAGQAFNDYLYVGVSSTTFGTLTFGRQRTLTTDDRTVYDPIAGSLAFSLLGYSGSLSSGDTENTRFDNSLKYLLNAGPARFGVIYKLDNGGSGSPVNGATFQVSAGFDYDALSFDAVYSHVSSAITLTSLTAAQVAAQPANSLAGTVSDNSAVLLSAKYTWNQFKFFGGYEFIDYKDPKDPLLAPYTDNNGYLVSVTTNDAYQYHDKILQLFWAGVKYAYNANLVLSGGYYHILQSSYGKIGCNFATPTKLVTNTATCSGTEDAVGVVAEYHFNKRLEIYGGLMYSNVTNGMASGFLYTNSVDPTVGLRYAF
jgi:predicted porin